MSPKEILGVVSWECTKKSLCVKQYLKVSYKNNLMKAIRVLVIAVLTSLLLSSSLFNKSG